MRNWIRMCLVVPAIALLLVPSEAGATHSWDGYHWARTSNPFTLRLGDNVSSAWDSYLATTSADWSASTVLDTTIVPGSTNPRTCKASAGRVQVCSASYGRTGWLGVAQIWLSGSHITKGTVKVNDTYFASGTYNTPGWRNLVMCQEVGHTFGLDHQDEAFDNPNLGTCMDYTSNPSGPPSNEHPNQHDYDELALIYAHLDGSTTVAATSPASGRAAGNSGGEWGRRVAGSDKPGTAGVYERDLGSSERLVTFVIWS